MEGQSPAFTASILLSCREDKRRSHASYTRPQISVEEQTEREPIAWVLYDSNLHALRGLSNLELERRHLKEATGHTCSDQHVDSPSVTFAFTKEQSNRAHGSYMQCHSNLCTATCLHCKWRRPWPQVFAQCPTLEFTVDVCFQLKNRQTKPRTTGHTCSDSNLLAMQVFITFAEVTGGGATGRACDDNNPYSLQLRWTLPTYRWQVAPSVTVTYGPLCMFLWLN